jgi:NADH-quinone oxidoreductase subunit L
MSLKLTLTLIPLLPLLAAIVAGLARKQVGRAGSHWLAILGVGVSCVLSCWVLYQQVYEGLGTHNITLYTWMVSDGIHFQVGFLLDHLTSLMMTVVTFVSLMVHIYTIGYMAEDPGYQRFFSYIALFTFSMLMLVMSNNFLQLFFGWEAVGLVSYLLIGFWFKRESAIFASLKAVSCWVLRPLSMPLAVSIMRKCSDVQASWKVRHSALFRAWTGSWQP